MAKPITFANERRKLKQLIPADWNPRKITEAQRAKLRESLDKFPEAEVPVINTDGLIVAGHQRISLYKEIHGEEYEIDVRIPSRKMTKAEVREYNIRSNANTGAWDNELLAEHFGHHELEAWGMEQFVLDDIFTPIDGDEGDEEAEGEVTPVADPVTKPGDIWLLGDAGLRLGCGDSCDPDHVKRLLDVFTPALMVTDPPYGVEYDPAWRDRTVNTAKNRATGTVHNDDIADWREAWALFPGDVAYVWHSAIHSHEVAESLLVCGFLIKAQIIWAKQSFALSRGNYHWQHEPCWYAVRKGKKHNWTGDRKQTSLWEIKNHNPFGGGQVGEDEIQTGHGTQKPVECMLRPILNNSSEGDFIYDPFLGSGTTIIAAERSKRICIGSELDPGYCDAIIQRFIRCTGQKVIHEETGEEFAAG